MTDKVKKLSIKQNRALAIGQALRTATCAESQLNLTLSKLIGLLGKEAASSSKMRANLSIARYFCTAGIQLLREFNVANTEANKLERLNEKLGESK